MLWIDVTDLVEFIAGGSTVSGVQRVEAQLAPLLLAQDSQAVILDRGRGVFIALTPEETTDLVVNGVSGGIATANEQARITMERASSAEPTALSNEPNAVLLVLGAAWINDQLMAAIREVSNQGVKVVDLFYDLTPILDAGHSVELQPLFERYLAMLSDVASRVPAISQSSRNDLAAYLKERNWRVPEGVGTGLPSGLINGKDTDYLYAPPTEKYALMVGTIEARKNHQLAFDAWQELINRRGPEGVPTLICVGRIGWNSEKFLESMQLSSGLNEKIQLRTESVSDNELAQLYRNCEFTVYPSDYEGWGLPVTESLFFGAPAVVARNSSLTEAGGDLACYFNSGDTQDLVRVIEETMLSDERRTELRERIAKELHEPVSWESVAAQLMQEVEAAHSQSQLIPVVPSLNQWHFYSLAAPHTSFSDRLVLGCQRPPQPWGIPVFLDQTLTINFVHDGPDHLTMHISTLNEAGVVSAEVNGRNVSFSRGEIISIDIGSSQAGAPISVTFRALDVGPSDSGFIGLTAIMVEGESAMGLHEVENLEIEKLRAENQALRTDVGQLSNELEQMRIELERKSQGLLSRASRRLNRPVKE